jgi:hypothetical protein
VIDTNAAGATVKVTAGEVMPLTAAVMLLVPIVAEVARPLVPPALLIVATAGVADTQVTEVVKFWVVLFEYVPVATNCCVRPRGMLGAVGVIAIDTNVAGVTVKVTPGEVMAPSPAVMLLVPAVAEVARPLVPPALLIVATAGVADTHATEVVKF